MLLEGGAERLLGFPSPRMMRSLFDRSHESVAMAEQGLAPGWSRPRIHAEPSPALPVEQLLLFPRHTLIEMEPDEQHADLYKIAQADNGSWYYLKGDLRTSPTRANEWIAHRLAGMVGIPVPSFCPIRAQTGDILFGSRRVDGVSDSVETALFLRTPSFNELGVLTEGLREALSAIYAFDMFVANVDRHWENYISIMQGHKRSLYAIDFARSLFYEWPLDKFISGDSQTRETWRQLRSLHGFHEATAQVILNRLEAVKPPDIESVLREMPSHWLARDRQDAFMAYCTEGGWVARVRQLREGFSNGSLA